MRTTTRSSVLPNLLLVSICALTPAAVVASDEGAETERLGPSHVLNVSIGVGLVAPDNKNGQEVSGSGEGFYGAAEYVFWPSAWFSPRLYSGLVIAPARADCGAGVAPCDVSAEFAFAGAKARVMAPLPWVAPFLELGLGASAGRFSTRSGQVVDQVTRGIAYHVPFALGVALGERRRFEIALLYLFHPEQKQFSGAMAVGLQFALD
jgi:hypothetical protein